jgi:hypothetical protein
MSAEAALSGEPGDPGRGDGDRSCGDPEPAADDSKPQRRDDGAVDAGPAPGGRLPRILQRLQRLRQLPRRARGVVLLVATVATAVAVVFAVRSLDLGFDELVWWPLIVAALVVTPVTIALNAAELRAMAVGVATDPTTVTWPVAVRTVVLATAANLLPIPAGAVIRVQVLRKAGATTTAAASVTLAAAAIWVGASLVLAGASVAGGEPLVGWLGVALGIAAALVGIVGVRVVAKQTWVAAGTYLGVVEVVTAVLHAGRLWLVLLGLGVIATLPQALVIGAASPLAAAAGFFPGGIGLAELLGALLAPLAGLAAAAALLSVAVGRLLGLAFTMPVALALGLRDLATPDPPVGALTGLDSP